MSDIGGVPFDDRGLLLGDGLFETLLARDGELVRLPAHLARLAAGCEALGLPPLDRARAEALLREAVASADAPRLAVRLTLTAGSGGRGLDRPEVAAARLFATAAPSMPPEAPARIVTSQVRRNDGSPASRLKTLAYLDNVLARREARFQGADEALMLNGRGEVACASAANVFWIAGDRLFTPALECGVLAGIVRGEVLGAARRLGVQVTEVRAAPAALARAEAMFLTNSLIGSRRVAEWDGRALKDSRMIESLAAEAAI